MLKYLLILIVTSCSTLINSERQCAEYEKWEKYSIEKSLKYPDFYLYYKGSKPGNLYPGETSRRMGDEYHFVAQSDAQKVDVVWSEGAGEIGPIFFTLDKKNYILEMVRSDIMDQWAPKDTVAIWLESEWKSKKGRSWLWRLLW